MLRNAGGSILSALRCVKKGLGGGSTSQIFALRIFLNGPGLNLKSDHYLTLRGAYAPVKLPGTSIFFGCALVFLSF